LRRVLDRLETFNFVGVSDNLTASLVLLAEELAIPIIRFPELNVGRYSEEILLMPDESLVASTLLDHVLYKRVRERLTAFAGERSLARWLARQAPNLQRQTEDGSCRILYGNGWYEEENAVTGGRWSDGSRRSDLIIFHPAGARLGVYFSVSQATVDVPLTLKGFVNGHEAPLEVTNLGGSFEVKLTSEPCFASPTTISISGGSASFYETNPASRDFDPRGIYIEGVRARVLS